MFLNKKKKKKKKKKKMQQVGRLQTEENEKNTPSKSPLLTSQLQKQKKTKMAKKNQRRRRSEKEEEESPSADWPRRPENSGPILNLTQINWIGIDLELIEFCFLNWNLEEMPATSKEWNTWLWIWHGADSCRQVSLGSARAYLFRVSARQCRFLYSWVIVNFDTETLGEAAGGGAEGGGGWGGKRSGEKRPTEGAAETTSFIFYTA